jgi:hypothetical protein
MSLHMKEGHEIGTIPDVGGTLRIGKMPIDTEK